MRAAAVAVAALVLSVGVAGAATWEETRKGVIDPLNGALHRRLPSFVKARDLDSLLALYVTDTGTGLTWDGAHRVLKADGASVYRIDRPPDPSGC